MARNKSGSKPDSDVSRRLFLKGSGAAAAATALATDASSAVAQQAGPQVVSGSVRITLNVNGEARQLTVEPRTTLLEALRSKLDLTGAKPVSDDGSSGASTVILEGKPVTAATVLAIACVGKKILTVESLERGGKLDALQQGFHEKLGAQCGYCTPGMIMAAEGLLKANPDPSEDDIRKGLGANICRCTGYVKIIEAVNFAIGELSKGPGERA